MLAGPACFGMLLTGCPSSVKGTPPPGTGDETPDAGSAGTDPGMEDAVGIEVDVSSLQLAEGEKARIDVWLVDEDDNRIDLDSSVAVTWASDDEEVATVDDGEVTGVAPGDAVVTVEVLTFAKMINATILDLSECCEMVVEAEGDNFCHIAPGTDECPMTLHGGYCDPDGDDDYDDQDDDEDGNAAAADWDHGALHFQAACDGPGECQLENLDILGQPCNESQIFEWHCGLVTINQQVIEASASCRDLDFNGTYQWEIAILEPDDCCACEGAVGDLDDSVPDVCSCTDKPDCL